MRAFLGIGGLLVLLVGITIMMSMSATHTQQVVKSGQTAKEEVGQIAGVDVNTGARASQSIDMSVMTSNNKPTSILVTKVVVGGAYEKYFGVERNDTIVAVDIMGTRMDIKSMNDEEMAKAQIQEAFQRQGSWYVKRKGQELKLPQSPAHSAMPSAAAPPESPAPENAPEPAGNKPPLQRQLDAITAPR